MKKHAYSSSADVIRVLAGFFVVIIHETDPIIDFTRIYGSLSWWLATLLNSFSHIAVPLFIMLSGYLLLPGDQSQNTGRFYKRRLLRVGIPLVVWLSVYFWWMAFWGHYHMSAHYIVELLFSGHILHLYFFYIILELYFITPVLWSFIARSTQSQKRVFFIALFVFSILLAGVNYLVPKSRFVDNAFTIFIPYISYYFAGYYFRNVRLSKVQMVLGILSLGILTAITAVVSYLGLKMFVFDYLMPNLIIMSALFFLLILSLVRHTAFFTGKRVAAVFKTIAPTIFGIFILHVIVRDVTDKYLHLYPDELHSPLWLFMIVKIFLAFAISFCIVFAVQKVPILRRVFG